MGAAQSTSLGPLAWEEGAPIHRLANTPMSEGADPIGTGRLSADVWIGFSNVFEQDSASTHELLLDMERLLTSVSVRFGVAPGLEIGGRVTLETTGGGITDRAVSRWHEALGFGNANRGRYPFFSHSLRLEIPGEGVLVDQGPRSLALDDVRLFAKWRLWRGPEEASVLSIRAVMRVPVQGNRVGAERADGSLMLLARRGSGRWFFHGMGGATRVRTTRALDPVLRNVMFFALVGVERTLTDGLSAVVQFSQSTPLLQGFGDRELDRGPGNLVFGLAGRLGERWRWEGSFQEDIPSDTPAVDFTLAMKLSRTW